MIDINLHTWFQEREMGFCPKHFVMVNTPVTTESKMWILERLRGRFYILGRYTSYPTPTQLNLPAKYARTIYTIPTLQPDIPFFEDPEEAMLYELTWS
jgi:hypothetical protein